MDKPDLTAKEEQKPKHWEKALAIAQKVNAQPIRYENCKTCNKLYNSKSYTAPYCSFTCRDKQIIPQTDKEYAERKESLKKRLDSVSLYISEKLLNYIDRHSPKAPFNQLVYAYGVLHDKVYPPNTGITINAPLLIQGHEGSKFNVLVGENKVNENNDLDK